MPHRTMYFVVMGLFLSVRLAAAQPAEEKPSPIVKNPAAKLPAGAHLQLGKLGGFRFDARSVGATLSADGKLLAVADFADIVTIVNLETGKVVHHLNGGLAVSNDRWMTFSADNSTLAIPSLLDLTVWDVAGGKQLLKLRGGHTGPSLSPDGKILGSALEGRAGKDKTSEVKAVEVATGKTIATFESIHTYSVRTAVAPDGKTMLSYGHTFVESILEFILFRSPDCTIQVWDLVNGKELRKIKLDAPVRSAAFAPDGKTIAAAVSASGVVLIDFETGKELRRFAGERTHSNVGVRFSPDGRRLAAFDRYGAVQAWDVADGKRITLSKSPMAQMLDVAFPAKDRVIAMGVLGQTLCWWDAADAKASAFEGHLAPVAALAFSVDGQTLISAGTDQRVIWWESATGKELRQFAIPRDNRYTTELLFPASVALTPDGKCAAIYAGFSTRGQGVQLWDLKDGRSIRTLRLTDVYAPIDLQFSADGSKLSGGGGVRAPARVWDVATGREVYVMPMAKGIGSFVDTRAAVSPDGKILAMQQHDILDRRQTTNEIVLWNLAEKKELRRIKLPASNPGAKLPAMTFLADGKLLAVHNTEDAILLFSTATGRECSKLASAARASTLQFALSADGRFFAAGSSPRFTYGSRAIVENEVCVEIWEIASGLKREHFKGHAAGITCVAFSPDSATLATGSMDTTVLLWDVAGKKSKAATFAEREIPAAWKSLAGADANLSVTMRRLIQSPATVGFLKHHLKPAKLLEFDDKKVAGMIADLDSDNFKTRDVAMRDLKLLGERVQPALQKALVANPTLEARRRIQQLLDALVRTQLEPEELQVIRGVEVLERIATPEAHAWLTALSKGDPYARGTREAAAALKRMPTR